jgi:hypothetical protein
MKGSSEKKTVVFTAADVLSEQTHHLPLRCHTFLFANKLNQINTYTLGFLVLIQSKCCKKIAFSETELNILQDLREEGML